ncbi:MAG: hypothetical protein COT24_05000 [Candidatus Kerfeldbacteria bacterium CG08_land_8_20_14_0_20_40_16]|uniref:DUF304 domain-containing protein n=1 Tax=Candidatus Kerfeldbacteria bacterium CG08_land_8_20_14_0_20_40_16 TaxID=2014244 RepID=A0A2H0YUN1_9BACT|nr:MAG: hypothetical protein COT24_05000 [Candidatus Kerfeldbacteria bacterium CG08_land_8_20_14_0_20_40_16]
MLRHFLLFVVEFFLPLAALFAFFYFTDFVFEKESPVGIVIILASSAYFLFIWLFFFNHWIDYYLDVWIVTNQRILNIEQEGLFSRTISELNLEMVQDATSEVKGKVATVLNFGNVYVQTAGEEKRFVFEEIPAPRQVASKIIELHQSAVKRAAVEEMKEATSKSLGEKDTISSPQKNETKTF